MNSVRIGRQPVLVAVCEQSLLSLVMPARDVRTLPARLSGLVAARLARLGVPADMIAAEVAAMAPLAVAGTVDRSVLGTLNECVYMTRHWAADGHSMAAGWDVRLEDWLGRMPMRATKGDRGLFPDQATVVAMVGRWAGG